MWTNPGMNSSSITSRSAPTPRVRSPHRSALRKYQRPTTASIGAAHAAGPRLPPEVPGEDHLTSVRRVGVDVVAGQCRAQPLDEGLPGPNLLHLLRPAATCCRVDDPFRRRPAVKRRSAASPSRRGSTELG